MRRGAEPGVKAADYFSYFRRFLQQKYNSH
jgi:hypothetical protein